MREVGDVMIDKEVMMMREGLEKLKVENEVEMRRIGENSMVDKKGY